MFFKSLYSKLKILFIYLKGHGLGLLAGAMVISQVLLLPQGTHPGHLSFGSDQKA
jgi:hypothetical protein